jgi:hypothetical protein
MFAPISSIIFIAIRIMQILVFLAYAHQMSVMEHSTSKVRSEPTKMSTIGEPYGVNQNLMI